MDYTKSSTNKVYAVYNGEDYEVHIYHTFPMGKNPASGIHHTSDVTEFFEEHGISVEESRAIHYKVSSRLTCNLEESESEFNFKKTVKIVSSSS